MKASSWALGLVLLASVAANFYTTYVAHCTAVALEKITADYATNGRRTKLSASAFGRPWSSGRGTRSVFGKN